MNRQDGFTREFSSVICFVWHCFIAGTDCSQTCRSAQCGTWFFFQYFGPIFCSWSRCKISGMTSIRRKQISWCKWGLTCLQPTYFGSPCWMFSSKKLNMSWCYFRAWWHVVTQCRQWFNMISMVSDLRGTYFRKALPFHPDVAEDREKATCPYH